MHVGIGLKLVLVDPYRDLIYVGNYMTGELSIISWKERRIIAKVDVGNRNQSLIMLRGSRRVDDVKYLSHFRRQK